MENFTFTQFVQWAFLGVLTGAVVWSAKFLSDISQSVQELNKQIATMLERINWHEKEIEDHSDRLKQLENKDCKRYDS